MRVLMKVKVPVQQGNAAVRDGALARIIETAMQELRPEAAYFTVEDGCRTALMFVDMADPSEMPFFAERFFHGLGATVDLAPVMVAADLQKGLPRALNNLAG